MQIIENHYQQSVIKTLYRSEIGVRCVLQLEDRSIVKLTDSYSEAVFGSRLLLNPNKQCLPIVDIVHRRHKGMNQFWLHQPELTVLNSDEMDGMTQCMKTVGMGQVGYDEAELEEKLLLIDKQWHAMLQSVNKAAIHHRSIGNRSLDLHAGNIGYYEGRTVLFDQSSVMIEGLLRQSCHQKPKFQLEDHLTWHQFQALKGGGRFSEITTGVSTPRASLEPS
ncbi:hypothetical protein AB6D11_00700 [Vibrio splendidus]